MNLSQKMGVVEAKVDYKKWFNSDLISFFGINAWTIGKK